MSQEEKQLEADARRDWRSFILRLQRHRKFQLVISFGTLCCAIAAIIIPHHGELIVLASTATNLIWIWE